MIAAASPAPLRPETAEAIRGRIERIEQDITSARIKIERIEHRIQRDRLALLHWQARLSGIKNETSLRA